MIISIDVPEQLYARAAQIAESQRISVSELLTAACAEHVDTWDRMKRRAQRGDRAKFLEVLSRVPDQPADESDC